LIKLFCCYKKVFVEKSESSFDIRLHKYAWVMSVLLVQKNRSTRRKPPTCRKSLDLLALVVKTFCSLKNKYSQLFCCDKKMCIEKSESSFDIYTTK